MKAMANIGTPPSIMIVDDTPANLEVLSDALTENGYRVRSAPSGRLALQAAHSDPPDLILLDIMMPEMDGYEVCRMLKEDGVTKDIPVIFITAMDRDYDEELGLSLGAVDYITKPIRLPIVMARVQYHVQMKMQRDGIEAQVMARTAELDAANRELKSEIAVRMRAEEKFRGIVEGLKTEYFFYQHDANGVFTYVSPSIAHVLGYSTEEFCAHYESFLTDSPVNRDVIDHTARSIQGMQQKPYEVEIRHRDGSVHHLEVLESPAFDADGRVAAVDGIAHDITASKQAETDLRRKNEELDLLVNSIASIIIGVSGKDRITLWNPFAEEVFGFKAKDIVGTQLSECSVEWDWERIYEAIGASISEDRTVRLDDVKYILQDGKDGILGLTVNPLKRGDDMLEGFIILGRDLTERRILENQLQQARKLEAIGQLAAGVAHEINSPLQYVGDNMKFIIKSISEILELQKRFVTNMEAASAGASCLEAAISLREFMSDIDIEYLTRELPKASEQTLEGVNRISTIVKSMKAFAHPGTDRKTPADINQSIANTITVSRNEWKYVANLETDFDTGLLPVPCFAAELNQVIFNMIVNAADAIREAIGKKIVDKGIIRISTKMAGGCAEIRVADNGAGIPEEIRQKVFDPFFTTKEVGKGTGQGLSIAFAIIVTKHGGTLRFETETGRGTTFIITLPLADTQ